jgi:hypothetical protein
MVLSSFSHCPDLIHGIVGTALAPQAEFFEVSSTLDRLIDQREPKYTFEHKSNAM